MVGHRYTDEEHEFLKSFVPGHTYKEIIDTYNKRFDEPITKLRLKAYIGNHKLNTGKTGRFEKGHIPANKGKHQPTVGRMAETQFKKGGLPPTTKPIGYERITKDGYIEVKVKMRPSNPSCNDNFILKHRLVWEEVNGPIPKGHKLIFLDGNRQNCILENLALVTNAENLQMTRKGLRSECPQLTKTGILIAQVGIATHRKKKSSKNASAERGYYENKKDCCID